MNNTLLLCSIFFVSLSSFVNANDYYRSNSIGMVFEQVPLYRIDEFDWIVEIQKEESREVRKIYFKSEIVQWFEYLQDNDSTTIKKYEGDNLIYIEHKKNGLVIKEEIYEEGFPVNKYNYEWSDRKLLNTSFYEKGVLVYVDTFVLGDKGRILQIRRLFQDNKLRTSGFSNPQKTSSFEWYGSDGDFILYKYNKGRIVRFENWKDGILNRKKIFTFLDTGYKVVETDLLAGQINMKEFDLNGNILWENISGGNIVQKTIYNYSNNLLMGKDIASSGKRLRYLYEYNNESNLIVERILRDDLLIKEIYFDQDKKILEKLYKDNSLLLIVSYLNGEKISEEFVK